MIHSDPPLQGRTLQGVYSKLLIGIFASVVLFLFAHPVFAYDLTVTCGGSCTKSTNDPLFSSSTIWYPGLYESKSIHIINTRNTSLSLSTSASNSVNADSLGDVMNLTIQRTGEPGTLWTGTLTNFYASVPVFLLPVPASGGTADLTYTIAMDTSADNEYQNTRTVFDLNFSFEGDDESQPAPTPGGGTDGGGGGTTGGGTTGGGTGGISGTSAPFLPITQFLTYFAPVGGGILGEETTENPPPPPEVIEEGQVAGAAACKVCFWWPLLVLQAVLLMLHYYITRKKNPKPFWIGGIILSIITYILFLFFNRTCRNGWQLWLYTDVFWCKYFFLWVILIFSILSRIFRPKEEETYEVNPEEPKKDT